MELLSNSALGRSEAFLKTHARKLEQTRYAYDCGMASRDDVLQALGAYRNSDGGFGHGLEPDIRLADSSALCTSVAFQIMREVSTPADHPMVREGIAYLSSTQDAESGVWFQVPPHVDEAPHAPWWDFDPDPANQMANPRAELLGIFYHYGQVPTAWRDTLADDIISYAERYHETLSVPDLVCYRRLIETEALPDALRERLLPPLSEAVDRLFIRHPNPEQWVGMGMGPLTLAPYPEAVLYSQLTDLVEDALDRLVTTQEADGSWGLVCPWNNRHQPAWPQTEREWHGVMTLETLRHLKAYGRVQPRKGDFPRAPRPVV